MHISRILATNALLAAGLSLAEPATAHAQFMAGTTYVEVGPGIAVQKSRPGFEQQAGFAGELAVGRYASPTSAYEVRVGFDSFRDAVETIPPCPVGGVCRGSTFHRLENIGTLGIDAQFSPSHATVAPLFIFGAGLRGIWQVNASPEQALDPYGELGLGLNVPLGSIALALEGRYQFAAAHGELPHLTAPFTLGVRF